MSARVPLLQLSRSQILAFRRRAGLLDERLPAETKSLHRAAWAGLQDSMPRAALLSIHARVSGTISTHWDHPSLVQLWGPRFSNYVVAVQDLPVFSLGRLPDSARRRARAHDIASRLHTFLEGRKMPFGEAGRAIGVEPNSLRYAAPTGTVLIKWDGARQPVIWTVAVPDLDPLQARLELARRYLHIFGPATAASFAKWAGVQSAEARTAFRTLDATLLPVRTPIGDAWILKDDEAAFLTPSQPAMNVRFLPSGDAYYLLWGVDRQLLLPHAGQRAALWTTRVWPGALLIGGEIVGIWRRSAADVAITVWRRLSSVQQEMVEAEANTLPLPALNGPVVVRWN